MKFKRTTCQRDRMLNVCECGVITLQAFSTGDSKKSLFKSAILNEAFRLIHLSGARLIPISSLIIKVRRGSGGDYKRRAVCAFPKCSER